MRQLRVLQTENAQLKRLLAERNMELNIVKEVLKKSGRRRGGTRGGGADDRIGDERAQGLPVAESEAKELPVPEKEGRQREADRADKGVGTQASEVWIPADMGFARKGGRIDKRKAGVPVMAEAEAGSAEAEAEKEAGTAVCRNNAKGIGRQSDLDVRLCV